MRLVYTKPVRARILEIHIHIAKEHSEERAGNVLRSLFDKTDLLLAHPLLGAPEPELGKRGKGHRSLIAGRYKIVYFVVEDTINITDFFDMRQSRSRMRG